MGSTPLPIDFSESRQLHRWRLSACPVSHECITVLQTLVIALGAGLGIWGVINLLEGYGNDNPGANAHVP